MKKELMIIPLLALKAHACEIVEYNVYAAITQVPKAKKYKVYSTTNLVNATWRYIGEVDKKHPSVQIDAKEDYMFFKCEERK